MKKTTIKQHLSQYSIFQKRKTTINHAFASALAPTDRFDEQVVDEAIRFLGQDPDGELMCVYCGGEATTWDHLVGLVKDGELRGYGHQIGNLVPCCARCNARKGSQDWTQFVEVGVADLERRSRLQKTLPAYIEQFAREIYLEPIKAAYPEDWARYTQLREEIFALMKDADEVAAGIRARIANVDVKSAQSESSTSRRGHQID